MRKKWNPYFMAKPVHCIYCNKIIEVHIGAFKAWNGWKVLLDFPLVFSVVVHNWTLEIKTQFPLLFQFTFSVLGIELDDN